MYPGITNSPETTITSDITDVATTIYVAELGVFPAAPNLATLGIGETAETVLYTVKSSATGGGNLTVTREYDKTGTYGAKKAWISGTVISRLITNLDLSAIQTNIDLKADLASPALTGTPTAPTAVVGTKTTQVATTEFVNALTPNTPLYLLPRVAIVPVTTPATLTSAEMGSGINYFFAEFIYTAVNNLQWMVPLPPEWSAFTFTFSVEWLTTSADLNTVKWDLKGVRGGNGATRNVVMAALQSVTDTNTGAHFTNVSPESTAFSITGTGNTVHFELSRDYATDTLDDTARLIAVKLTPV